MTIISLTDIGNVHICTPNSQENGIYIMNNKQCQHYIYVYKALLCENSIYSNVPLSLTRSCMPVDKWFLSIPNSVSVVRSSKYEFHRSSFIL